MHFYNKLSNQVQWSVVAFFTRLKSSKKVTKKPNIYAGVIYGLMTFVTDFFTGFIIEFYYIKVSYKVNNPYMTPAMPA